MFHSPKEGGLTAHTLPPTQRPDDRLQMLLREHVHQLRLILPLISVSVLALHRQRAENDDEIATILDHYAREALELEIETVEGIIASLTPRRPVEVAA